MNITDLPSNRSCKAGLIIIMMTCKIIMARKLRKKLIIKALNLR